MEPQPPAPGDPPDTTTPSGGSGTVGSSGTAASAALLAQLEALSQARPDRVLRLRGTLPAADGVAGDEAGGEAFELVIFRGFSSSTTHPTAFDPDQPALDEGAWITAAELLQGPLRPGAEQLLAGPLAVEAFLNPEGWQ